MTGAKEYVEDLAFEGEHEEVSGIWRKRSGLRAIVAIHSTALGPSLGGTRFRSYPSVAAALGDVLALSRAMSYKAAVAGLAQGGGKAVIIGDPEKLRSPELLEDYAMFLNSFGGRYYTAEDVGTTQADMDELGKHTSFVTGRSVAKGGSGDPSPATAYGVLRAMQATALRLFGTDSLSGRTVAISGVGKVGGALAELAADDGAKVVVADVDDRATGRLASAIGARVVSVGEIHAVACDIYSPCALGGAINGTTVAELSCRAVVGAANNQLSEPALAEVLAKRQIAYVPDFVCNAGGIINISYEKDGYNADAAKRHIGRIFETVGELFEQSESSGLSLIDVAELLAEEKMAEAADA